MTGRSRSTLCNTSQPTAPLPYQRSCLLTVNPVLTLTKDNSPTSYATSAGSDAPGFRCVCRTMVLDIEEGVDLYCHRRGPQWAYDGTQLPRGVVFDVDKKHTYPFTDIPGHQAICLATHTACICHSSKPTRSDPGLFRATLSNDPSTVHSECQLEHSRLTQRTDKSDKSQ